MGAGSVTVLLKVNPPPAVWLDGKPWKGRGDRIEGITAGEEHKIVLSADGYAARTVSFTAQPGETKLIEAQLLKSEPGRGDPGSTTATPVADSGGQGQAKVRVGAKGGFCNVVVNGAAVGPTPVEAPVKAGTVRISCKAQDGRSLSQTVRVSPGDTARVSFKLD
jgi:serine/threonine-protein kinase